MDNSAENSIVSLVKSEKEHASQITEEEINQLVRQAVKLAGGLNDIVKDGQVVVIKPNLVGTRTAPGNIKPLLMPTSNPYNPKSQIPELMNGVTTDRRVAKAMVEMVRELNPTGKVYIMECAGDGPTSENFKRLGYTHENIPGVDEFIPIGEHLKFRDVDSEDLVALEVENQQYQKLPKFLKGKYYYDKTYYNADVVISLAVLKNHMNTGVSGGIKNVGIGARPANIYANGEGKTVSAFVIDHQWDPINDFIRDYYVARPVYFVLTDGLQGLQYGNMCQGAPSYEAAKMNMRVILASKDPVAADAVQSCIVGVDPEKIKHLADLARDGFGTTDTSKINVVGNTRVDEIKKRFGLAGGLLRLIYRKGVKESVYNDFDGPEFSIEEITAENDTITIKLKVDAKTTKVELSVDGKVVSTFTKGFDDLIIKTKELQSSNIIAIYAYDKYLNCTYKTAILNPEQVEI